MSFSSITLEKIGFWCGMLLAGGALVVGGAKALEHASFIPAEARVTGTEIRCEMNSVGDRHRRSTQLVMCGDVANIKAQNPDVDWRVSAEPFVTLAFTTAAGVRISTPVALDSLDRTTTAVGDWVSILYRADRPAWISTQATPMFFVLNGSALAGGLLLCAVAFGLQRRREMAEHGDSAVAAPYLMEASATLPAMSSPPMWAEPAQAAVKPQVA